MSDAKPPWIPVAAPVIGAREIECVTDAVTSGWVSSVGPYLERFEQGFAKFTGARHAVAVSNGTVALHLALHALGVGPGDEVIVPELTFAATAHTVLQTGATPVFVDALPDTWCLDPRAVEHALGPRTKAILPVHLYGHAADLPALSALAAPRQLPLIEDAAEAHGAAIGGRRVGPIGRAGAFSFYGNKIMTTGEGGMVVTDDDALAERLRFLKDHGMSKARRYYHSELAFNYRMTNLQAALGVAQLEQIEGFIQHKRDLFGWYQERLGGHAGLTLNVEQPGTTNVYWMVCVVLGDRVQLERDAVCARLAERGVDTRPFFVPMTALPHLAQFRALSAEGEGCPQAMRLGARGFNLPSSATLTRAQVDRVCDALLQVVGK